MFMLLNYLYPIFRHLQVNQPSHDDEDVLYDHKIWIPDSQLGYRLCSVLDDGLSDVLVGFRDEQGFFEKKRVERIDTCPPSRKVMSDDLCTLTEPNTATVLDSLSKRYQHGVIHTYCGLFCVVINPWKTIPIYSKDVMSLYRNDDIDRAPHIFSIAQAAYDGIMRGHRNQSILITGESGAGKTENTKKIIDFIMHSCGSSMESDIANDVITTGILLEAFGNAKTTHNYNSSRFGKFIKMNFDETSQLSSAQIECYLLEKSRVVSQNEGERNFHIFYQLFSDKLPAKIRRSLLLNMKPSQYKFLNQGGVATSDEIDDCNGALETENAMTKLGINEEDQMQIYQLCAACVLIGEIRFGERSGMDLSFVESNTEVEQVASLLGLRGGRIVDALTSPTIKIGDKLIRKNQNLKKTLFSASAMAKVIYERLFNWILEKCNKAIHKELSKDKDENGHYIGVLDIAGFEIIEKNSFEQFCINFTNEKLQQFFNHFMFVKEQAEYQEEGIPWDLMNFANDLQPTIDLIEKPMGLLALLEDECVMPNGSDTTLLEKFLTNCSSSSAFHKAKQSKKNKHITHFSVQHYAGNVDYNVTSWIEKNRDVVEHSVLALLSESSGNLLKELFPPVSNDFTKTRRGTMCQASVSFTYKNQLQNLLDCLNITAAHFIRCVVPNYERKPGVIDGNLVVHQLRCNGVLEGIRICRKGYPSRIPFAEFTHRYSLLVGASAKFTGRAGCEQLLNTIDYCKDKYKIGHTKVFCRVGVISELEHRRRHTLALFICKLQAHIRSYSALRDCDNRARREEAVVVVQSNVRVFGKLSSWPWFRLMQLVIPLIPKDREKLRIVELEKLIDELNEEIKEYKEENNQLTEEMNGNEAKYLKDLDTLEKEKNKLESRLIREVDHVLSDYKMRLERAEEEKRELQAKIEKAIKHQNEENDNRMEAFEQKLKKVVFDNEQEKKNLLKETMLAKEQAAELEQKLEQINKEKKSEMSKLKDDLLQNEDILEVLEKKYNEQHNNVMKLNDTLREYERKIDDAQMTNKDLSRDLQRAHEALERENENKCRGQKEIEECMSRIAELEGKLQMVCDENNQLKLLLAKQENETEDGKSRNMRQNNTITDLQKLIEELNSKVAKNDQEMLEEKNKRRKVEKERDRVEEESRHIQEQYDKLKKKYESIKDLLRQKEHSLKIYEKKLEDKEAVMNDCVKDLKSNHKAKLSELEEKIDEYKRKANKLESENNIQKMKLESSTFDRESSVDSDYTGRSSVSRLSTIGRQYSLTSVSSFSSVRALNRRRETEPELSSSMYIPRRRDSHVDLSSSSYGIQKSSSITNFEKERRISELERHVQSLNTDLNLQKRELEVYKTSLGSLESERERILTQNRSQQLDIDNLKRQADRAEKNSDSLAMRLKRALEDAEQWKKRHEDLINETKNDILTERKRANEKVEAVRHEYDGRQERYHRIETSKDELQDKLNRCETELQRALSIIQDLENNVQTQERLGGSLESSHRDLLNELQSIRDENGLLQSRIRRQAKQIELLTQQDSTNDLMNHMNSKVTL
ncbi:unnamed protein product [Auanema sp. JU1783]|nr:unnamed protein product [Auanema sp. JU1783]